MINHSAKNVRGTTIKKHKILILRPDGIGDLLNSTPAIALLRRCYPDAHIAVLVRPLNAEILIGNPDINEIIIYDKTGLHKKFKERLQFFYQLRQTRYDVAIVMYTAWWCNWTAYISGAKVRVGRYQKRFKRTLTHPYKRTYPKGTVHEIERNLDLARMICDSAMDEDIENKTCSANLVLNLSAEERQWARDNLNRMGITENDFLVCIHPGGSSFDKLWPEVSYAQIADRLIEQKGAKILLIHGPSESALAHNIQQFMTNNFIIYAPESLRQLSAMAERCHLFLCNDSGPMHIATALGVSTVAIFGPTDYVRWAPRHEYAVIARRDMPCWPCKAHKCSKNFECTKHLPVETVWEKIETLLTKLSYRSRTINIEIS